MSSLKKNPILKFCASIKITVVCLFLLFILTFWGTVAQVSQGLYQAQEQYFHSWYFLAFGFLPFPGAQLILWILFVNLLAVSVTRFVYKWSYLGILVIHLGLLSYFLAAFITFHVVEESNLTLLDGEGSNVSTSYHDWEISVWEDQAAPTKQVLAYDSNRLKNGDVLGFPEFGLNLHVKMYYANATAYTDSDSQSIINASGINKISKSELSIEPEKNYPGAIFQVVTSDRQKFDLILYGQEQIPTSIEIKGRKIKFLLRRKRLPLPITVKLDRFEMEKYPGTEMARSYKSYATIDHKGVERAVEIFMNHPFRHKEYTFYQASYSVDQMGRYRSTLAVVKNIGRLLPYISSLVTFAGLAIHFLLMAFKPKKS